VELGDLALTVEKAYGEHRLEDYAESIEVDYNRLLQYRWVAGAYEFSVRTENLSWTHHERIASRPDRLEWLSLATVNRWSVRAMLERIAEVDEEARIAAEREAELARLRDMYDELAEAVESGAMTLQEAMLEAWGRSEKARQEREDHEGRMRRSRARLDQLLIGWIELEV
jgi:hypothetical protein